MTFQPRCGTCSHSRCGEQKLPLGVQPDSEVLILLTVVTGLSQGVLDGQITATDAFASIDYALDRALTN